MTHHTGQASAQQAVAMLEGAVTLIGREKVCGWVRQPDQADQPPVIVQLEVNQQVVAESAANEALKETGHIRPHRGGQGFSLTFPHPPKPSDVVRVKVKETERYLKVVQPAQPSKRRRSLKQPPPAWRSWVENLRGSTVTGWIYDPAEPERSLAVDVYLDGVKQATVTADEPRKDLAAQGIGSGRNGFRYVLPAAVQDGNHHALDVCIGGGDTSLRNAAQTIVLGRSGARTKEKRESLPSTVAPEGNPEKLEDGGAALARALPEEVALAAPAPAYEGKLDAPAYPYIRGWVWDRRRPQTALAVEIYINDALVLTLTADTFRGDLSRAGKGDGCKSFRARIPVPIEPNQAYTVRARVAGDDFELPGSPATLRYIPAEPAYRSGIAAPDPVRVAFHLQALRGRSAPTVIVPIYNAYEEVRRCLRAIVENTTLPSYLLLIDDASTDSRIAPLLRRYAGLPHVSVFTHEENQGFTRTVNQGMVMAEGDVVLLNSDTEVTQRWLEHLAITAYQEPRVASVTAVSDHAGAFSVTDFDDGAPPWLERDRLGRLIAGSGHPMYPDAPTGNGFCLYIRRAALEDVGLFDGETFPRGYGEENDFCIRAVKRGWKHLVDGGTFVFHRRSASFGEEKSRLIRESYAVLRDKHPDYDALVQEFVRSGRMHAMRKQVRQVLEEVETAARTQPARPAAGLPRVLYVLHGGATGGTPQTNADLMRAVGSQYDTFCLDCDTETIRLCHYRDGVSQEVERWTLPRPIHPAELRRDDYTAILFDVLRRYAIELVHIRQLYKHTLQMPEIAHALQIPVVLSFHDFYYICPTINLLDERNVYCGGVCTAGAGECGLPFQASHFPKLKHHWVHEWRARVRAMLSHVDACVTTGDEARNLYRDIFPELESKPFEVIEHGRDFPRQEYCATTPAKGGKINILVPGQLTLHKGAEFIEALLREDQEAQRLSFHFLGNLPERYQHLGVWHGRYEREEFQQRFKAIAPHFAAIFSIWPETYCHTLSEAWACGVPVLASNLGALKERIGRHGGGWLLDITDAAASYRRIIGLAEDAEAYAQEAARARLSNLRDTRSMGHDYAALYKRLMAARRRFVAAEEAHRLSVIPRLGYLASTYDAAGQGGDETVAPLAYEYVTQWLHHPLIRRAMEAIPLDSTSFLAEENMAETPDGVLLLRGSLSAEQMIAWRQRCHARGIPLIYAYTEAVQDCHDAARRKQDDWRQAENALLDAAALVIVPNAALADCLSSRCRRVALVPDTLDAWPWLRPLPSYRPPHPRRWNQETAVNVLYLATGDCARELALLAPVFAELKQRYGVPVTLHAIGAPVAEDAAGEEAGYVPIRIPPGYAGDYVRLVSWLRSESYRWDFAVAPMMDMPGGGEDTRLALYYAALGLPAVYSDIAAYRQIIRDGENGSLTANDPASWQAAILRAVNDCDAMLSMATAAWVEWRREQAMSDRVYAWMQPVLDLLCSPSDADTVAALPTLRKTETSGAFPRLAQPSRKQIKSKDSKPQRSSRKPSTAPPQRVA